MTPEQRAAWLELLTEGDEVAVVSLRSESQRTRCVVRRIASVSTVQRQITVYGTAIRFDRQGRSHNGGDKILQPVTDDVRAHVRRTRLLMEIQNFDLQKAPIEVLEKIREVQRSSGVGQVLKNMGDRAQDNLRRNREERRLLGVNR